MNAVEGLHSHFVRLNCGGPSYCIGIFTSIDLSGRTSVLRRVGTSGVVSELVHTLLVDFLRMLGDSSSVFLESCTRRNFSLILGCVSERGTVVLITIL